MIALLDTSIVVDLLRDYPPAHEWFQTQGQFGVARVVWIEILEGASNRIKQDQAIKLLNHFEMIEVTADDLMLATQLLMTFSLSHNIDGYDCMLAAVVQRLKLPLYTRNMKHFVPLIGTWAVKPY